MCGIVAISSANGQSFDMDRALAAIHHRGPDASGSFQSPEGDCQLGHVRLSIVDLSNAGAQPMADSSGRFIMVFNGEVYNFKELKTELDRAYSDIPWRSHSDSEVVVEGYARQGIKFLDRLNGIFALSIYDCHSQQLLILRDPVGIKPLYIYQKSDNIIVSSEVKGIRSFPQVQTTIRQQSLADTLSFMYVPEPHTMYNEILRVEPGVYQIYRKGKLVDSGRLFEHLHEQIDFADESEMVYAFRGEFSKAVKRQLMGDVPVSLFLSGGLDSSAVAYETLNHGATVKDAYTISFSAEDSKFDQQSDDVQYAKIVADKLGIKLHTIEAKKDLVSILPQLSDFMEDGLADPAAINTYLISKGARENGVKVMLSGQGADEYLGGYRRYLAEKMYSSLSPALLKALSWSGKLIPNKVSGRFNGHVRRLNKLTQTAALPEELRRLSLYMWNTPETVKGLFRQSDKLVIGRDHIEMFSQLKNRPDLETMMAVDQKYDLRSLNLAYTDKMSMATGVEARVPFLDFDLIRMMNSIPLSMKISGNTQKYILKKAMEPYLPHDVIYRQKAGFALPIRSWLKDQNDLTRHYLDVTRLEAQGIFDGARVAQMCTEQFSGQADHSYTLFAMISLQIWLERH